MLKTNYITYPPLPSFKLTESDLGMGASLGNSALWVYTKGSGAVERVFLNSLGLSLTSAVCVRYGARGRQLAPDVSLQDGRQGDDSYSGIYPLAGTRRFEIHPAYQRVSFDLASVIELEETTFLPLAPGAPGHRDPPVLYIVVRARNRDDAPHPVRVVCSAVLRGDTLPDVHAYFDEDTNALVASNVSNEAWVRIFAVSERPCGYGTDVDFGATYDPSRVYHLQNTTGARGDLIGRLQVDLHLEPQEERQFFFTMTLGCNGANDALAALRSAGDAGDALQQSIEHLKKELCHSRVLTPDAVINEGALWSKVNMRRVMAAYPIGDAFTNDPGQSTNVVIRDSAWFVYGNDHFLPQFSRDLLDGIAARQYSNGKLPEYIDAVEGRVEDYGLNINDNTPLFILAVNHHFRATGNVEWLRNRYSNVARAARHIMSQMDDRGLVFCSSDDSRGGVWAIAGWRNIIPEYKINGAVTELNAECVAALRAAGHLAENLGGLDDDARAFREASLNLKSAMDKHLINPLNGLYYLNIDVGGTPRTDVTGDQIFPVMMRACGEETGFRIISRLNYDDFWTAAGLRTVSRNDPRFDPCARSGLMGGIWPGLTWWYAFGAARYHPEVMVRALRSSFEHYGADPRRNNTVPGQFSEWFDGESLENRGMRLSPWEPPRFLWAAIEGVCGLVLSPGLPHIMPLIPSNWSWVGIRDLPHQGSFLTYFIVREGSSGFRIYTTAPVESEWEAVVYERDVTDLVRVYSDEAVAIALARKGGAVILIGNTSAKTVHTPVLLGDPAQSPQQKVYLRLYDSERSGWDEYGILRMEQLHGNALSIESGGFRLIELTAVEEAALS